MPVIVYDSCTQRNICVKYTLQCTLNFNVEVYLLLSLKQYYRKSVKQNLILISISGSIAYCKKSYTDLDPRDLPRMNLYDVQNLYNVQYEI